MIRFYAFALICLITCGLQAQTSSAAMASCKNTDEGTVTLSYNALLNCPDGTGVEGLPEAGLHSTPDGWTTVLAFDDPSAVRMINNGADTFEVTINTSDYYGVALDLITEVTFVLNNPANATDPWMEKGSDTTAGLFGCGDLIVVLAEIDECATGGTTTSIEDLSLISYMDVMPNPVRNEAVLQFGNPMGLEFTFVLMDATGRIVRTEIARGNQVRIDRDGLPAGMYFVSLISEGGVRASSNILFQ